MCNNQFLPVHLLDDRSTTAHLQTEGLADYPVPPQAGKESALADFGRSIAYSALQGPVDAVTQAIDHEFPTNYLQKFHWLDAPATPDGTLDKLAQETGSAIGMVIPVLALHTAAKYALRAPTSLEAQAASTASLGSWTKTLAGRAGVSALAGFGYGALFTPVMNSKGSFWQQKLDSGLINAATFGTLAGSGMGAQRLGAGLEQGWVKTALTHPVSSSMISGAIAGGVRANTDSLLTNHKGAGLDDTLSSMASFAIMGGLFGYGETKLDSFVSSRTSKDASLQNAPSRSTSVDALTSDAQADITHQPSSNVTQPESQAVNSKPDYLSDTTSEDGTRVIIKKDGTKITIVPGQKPKVELPPDLLAAKLLTKGAPAEPAEKPLVPRDKQGPPDFSHLPLNERPLNVGSVSDELIAREMSNFENSPFVLDGKEFASVEGFYVWLKYSGNPEKQALAQRMSAYEAKRFGKASTNTTAEYDGQTIKLGSPEHHALVKRAIQAKLEQHPDLARRFAETYPRPVIHNLGPYEPPSRLPNADFAKMLTELRQDLIDGKIVTTDGPVARLSELARQRQDAEKTFPLSALLESMRSNPDYENHPIDRYIDAFQNFTEQPTGIIGGGADSLVFQLPENQVLKITNRVLPENWNPRQNVLHIIKHGKVEDSNGVPVHWFTQPLGSPATQEQFEAFLQDLARQGETLTDSGIRQVSVYNGAVKVHDPFAVQKLR